MDTKINAKTKVYSLHENSASENGLSENTFTGGDSQSSTENLPETIVEVEVHENADDENFILNKFLYESNRLRDLNENLKLKKPVPTPRKLKSKETVEIRSNKSSSTDSDNSSVQNSKPFETQLTDQEENIKVNEPPLSKNHKYDYNKIVEIIVHRTDRLKLDSFVIHPLVKIHIVKITTGEYLLKSDVNRSVMYYYENKDIPYITPTLTQPFNLYKNHSVYPKWEETIVVNEDVTHVVKKDTIIFFEIVDFVSYAVVVSQADKKGLSQGWHKIAWAFLKVVGRNGECNMNQNLRLQLFYPHKYNKTSPNICPVFNWWKSKKFNKYPSTIYVTLNAIAPLEHISETLRSKTPTQAETSTTVLFEREYDLAIAEKASTSNEVDANTNLEPHPSWGRLKHQTCKLPNTLLTNFPSFEEGCFVMKFSNNGLYLACAVLINTIYCIVIYSVVKHKEVYRYSVHQGLIYDIIWTFDDEKIITSSADCTVSVWNFNKSSLAEMLPHPSYVYATDVTKNDTIATGCFDKVVRIWCPSNKGSYDLIHELHGHKDYVTSLCFSNKSNLLYSANAVGVVIEWIKEDEDQWVLKRELKWADLRGTIINQIVLHKRERRLLIHARDSSLRMIDLKTGSTLQWLQGGTNNRFRTTCCFSPCGTFVLAGGELNYIGVWNVDLGRLVAFYSPCFSLNIKNLTVHCVQFHPYDNILAISHYGYQVPILLATYVPNAKLDSLLGLRMVESDIQYPVSKCSKNEKVKKNFSEQKFKSVQMEAFAFLYQIPYLTRFSDYQKSFNIRMMAYVIMGIYLVPALIFGVKIYFNFMKLGKVITLFKPSNLWGPPTTAEKVSRMKLNRLEEFYYNSKVECKHNCLLNSDDLQYEIRWLRKNKFRLIHYMGHKD
ncbi:hypothetical protein RN001_009318 [Aquatica leii]|uniref:Uncharacterized protein n=1 Tax=Aquatica leii TaxID=1421715 RepID=A0AAN7SDS6_9COLE|nr:hypothetical protein RN001_009318 [Aquatica leii]